MIGYAKTGAAVLGMLLALLVPAKGPQAAGGQHDS